MDRPSISCSTMRENSLKWRPISDRKSARLGVADRFRRERHLSFEGVGFGIHQTNAAMLAMAMAKQKIRNGSAKTSIVAEIALVRPVAVSIPRLAN